MLLDIDISFTLSLAQAKCKQVLDIERHPQYYSKPSLAPRKGGYAVPLLHTAFLTQKHP